MPTHSTLMCDGTTIVPSKRRSFTDISQTLYLFPTRVRTFVTLIFHTFPWMGLSLWKFTKKKRVSILLVESWKEKLSLFRNLAPTKSVDRRGARHKFFVLVRLVSLGRRRFVGRRTKVSRILTRVYQDHLYPLHRDDWGVWGLLVPPEYFRESGLTREHSRSSIRRLPPFPFRPPRSGITGRLVGRVRVHSSRSQSSNVFRTPLPRSQPSRNINRLLGVTGWRPRTPRVSKHLFITVTLRVFTEKSPVPKTPRTPVVSIGREADR